MSKISLLPSSIDLPLRRAAGGARVTVRLAPRAGADRLQGLARLADGSPAVAVSVAAPPADGRANEALLKLLARQWNLSRRDLRIVVGLTSRSKVVEIAGDPDATMARLAAALAELPRGDRQPPPA